MLQHRGDSTIGAMRKAHLLCRHIQPSRRPFQNRAAALGAGTSGKTEADTMIIAICYANKLWPCKSAPLYAILGAALSASSGTRRASQVSCLRRLSTAADAHPALASARSWHPSIVFTSLLIWLSAESRHRRG